MTQASTHSPVVEHIQISDDDLLRMTIMNKTLVSERGCWEWQGSKSTGYGTIMRNRKIMYVHRVENIADIVERGRHGAAKLTEEQVREIRESKESTNVLANRFGVRWVAINRARRGATWGHVKGGEVSLGKGRSAATGLAPHSKITWLDAEVIRGSKLSTWLLSSIYGITRKSVANIRNGVTWKSLTTPNRGVNSVAG